MKCDREIYMQRRRMESAKPSKEHAQCVIILTIAFLFGLILLAQ
jgi:hypothetical protein